MTSDLVEHIVDLYADTDLSPEQFGDALDRAKRRIHFNELRKLEDELEESRTDG